jgi:hypothetical protein
MRLRHAARLRERCVFVNLAAHEPATAGALFAQDFGTMLHGWIVDNKSVALAAGNILGFVKTVAAQLTGHTQPPTLVTGEHALLCILHDQQAIAVGNVDDRVHLTGDAGIVDGDMARVRGVTACSISRSLMLSVSDLTATNTGLAPRSMNAFAVETKL